MTSVPAVTMITSQIAVMIAAAEKRLLDQLRTAGATDPRGAVVLQIQDEMSAGQLRTMIRKGLVVESEPGRYYLDEAALAQRGQAGHRVRLWIISTVLLIGAVAGVLLLVR